MASEAEDQSELRTDQIGYELQKQALCHVQNGRANETDNASNATIPINPLPMEYIRKTFYFEQLRNVMDQPVYEEVLHHLVQATRTQLHISTLLGLHTQPITWQAATALTKRPLQTHPTTRNGETLPTAKKLSNFCSTRALSAICAQQQIYPPAPHRHRITQRALRDPHLHHHRHLVQQFTDLSTNTKQRIRANVEQVLQRLPTP